MSSYENLYTEVLKPFEEATDILQGDTYNLISLVIPSFISLKKHLEDLNTHHSTRPTTAFESSLDHRLGAVLEELL